ncbi:hypothetical protein pb186bvf_012776 [Paramecium bursaria]
MNGKQMTLVETTRFIEQTIIEIQQNPEEQISQMKFLLELLSHENILIVQMVILALAELFIDIAPLYKIDKNAHQDKLQKFIKKEEKLVVGYELSLLNYYEQFVNSVTTFIKVVKQEKFQQTCFTCLCKLLGTLFHFNCTRMIAQYVTFGILNENVSDQCKDCVKYILQNKQHSIHELKIHILIFIQKIFQTKSEKELPDDFIEILRYVVIDTKYLPKNVDKEIKDKKRDLKKKKREFFSQKEKDKKKQKDNKEQIAMKRKILKEVQQDKEEAQADIDKVTIAKHNGSILAKLFYIYFKIIKSDTLSKFYNQALDGILQYVHLINVDLIQNLLLVLVNAGKQLRKKQNKLNALSILDSRLQTVYTLTQIIDGPGQVFSMDDKETTAQLYTCLLDIANKKLEVQCEKLILQLLDSTFIMKRHFSQEAVGSFIKILAVIAVQQNNNQKFQYCLLFALKLLIQKYNKSQKMLEEDNIGYGLYCYDQIRDDPASTNALNSSIYEELNQIRKSTKDAKFQSLINKILKQEQLPQHLQAKRIQDLY